MCKWNGRLEEELQGANGTINRQTTQTLKVMEVLCVSDISAES